MSWWFVCQLLNIRICLCFFIMYGFIFFLFSHYLSLLNSLDCGLDNRFRLVHDTRISVAPYDTLIPHDVAGVSGLFSVLHFLYYSGGSIEFVVLLQEFCSHFNYFLKLSSNDVTKGLSKYNGCKHFSYSITTGRYFHIHRRKIQSGLLDIKKD